MATERFQRDISATLAELEKWVAAAFPSAQRTGGQQFLIETPAATLELTATPGPMRTIALLSLPTLKLDYHFVAGDTSARSALLKRLDMFMHRGGG